MAKTFDDWFASMPPAFQKAMTDGKHVMALRRCFVSGMSTGVEKGVAAMKQKMVRYTNGINVNLTAFQITLDQDGFTKGDGI